MSLTSSRAFVLAGVLALAPSCRSAERAGGNERAAPQAPAPAATSSARRFGAPLTPSETVSLGRVLADPDAFANRAVTIEAHVRRNCTRRGCWMEIAEGADPSGPGCRVTFKDYGFFVPLDSAGSTARVQGTLEVKSVPASEVLHLEGEGAKFAAKQADGSAREVRLVATGVELRRGPG